MNPHLDDSRTPSPPREQLLRIGDVVALTTLSKSCINLWVAQGRFPRPTVLSSTVKVWRLSDLSEWIEAQFGPPEGANSTYPSVEREAV